MKILFVCFGNIQRSQWAETFFNNLSKKNNIAISAGLAVEKSWSESNINQISKNSVLCMREEGYDISKNVPKQLTRQMVLDSDKVIVLEKNYWLDYLKKSDKVILWNFEDPMEKNMSFRRVIRDNIKKKVLALIKELER